MARILICDDSNFVMKTFEKRLVSAGHAIAGRARDGEVCVKLYAQVKPDLVLLDITMPNADGRSALKEIMKMDRAATVVVVTAVGGESLLDECLAMGAKAVVSKIHLSSEESFKKYVIDVINPILTLKFKHSA
jgi:two-component system, chemotaxis family, chemotaxis protein CheY